MLEENSGIISFVPGSVKKGTLGQIVVHDRLQVEKTVLPKYFNHSSFASLRRQLNYFSFARQGKGRQMCATYSNDQVVELEDILLLRRRPAAPAASGNTTTTTEKKGSDTSSDNDDGSDGHLATPTSSVASGSSKKRSRNDTSPSSRSGGNKKSRFTVTTPPAKTTTTTTTVAVVSPNLVSPRSSPSHSATPSPKNSDDDDGLRITLDLTVPPPPDLSVTTMTTTFSRNESVASIVSDCSFTAATYASVEEDVLDGCRALLSFKSGEDAVMPVASW
jgi:HSF-type DNA-binding